MKRMRRTLLVVLGLVMGMCCAVFSQQTEEGPDKVEAFRIHISKWEVAKTQDELLFDVQGTTDFPDKIILKVRLVYENALGEAILSDNLAVVEEGRFQVEIGPFSREKKLIPGEYNVHVFYSPMFQTRKLPSAVQEAGMIEVHYPVALGKQENYEDIFNSKYQEAREIFSEIDSLYEWSQREFGYFRQNSAWEEWYAWSGRWQKRFAKLKEKERNYNKDLLFPLFPVTYHNIYPILNILEDLVESQGQLLKEGDEASYMAQKQQFRDALFQARNTFHYQATAIAPNPQEFFLNNKHRLIAELGRSAPAGFPSDNVVLAANEKREAAIHLFHLRVLHERLRNINDSPASEQIQLKNRWLFELKQQDYRLRQDVNHLPFQRDWTRLLQIIINKEQPLKQQPEFSEYLQYVRERYQINEAFLEALWADAHDLLDHLDNLGKMLLQPVPKYVWQNKIRGWSSNLLYKQEKNQQLLSLYEGEGKEEYQQLQKQFILLHMKILNFYDSLKAKAQDKEKLILEVSHLQEEVEKILEKLPK